MRPWMLLFPLFLLSCATLPQDFALQYRFGSCNQAWGWTQISVTSSGEVAVKLSQGNLTKHYQLSAKQIQELYEAVTESNFTGLEAQYKNPYVEGGMCLGMYAKVDGVEKKVEIANMPVPAVSKISGQLVTILDSVDSEWHR